MVSVQVQLYYQFFSPYIAVEGLNQIRNKTGVRANTGTEDETKAIAIAGTGTKAITENKTETGKKTSFIIQIIAAWIIEGSLIIYAALKHYPFMNMPRYLAAVIIMILCGVSVYFTGTAAKGVRAVFQAAAIVFCMCELLYNGVLTLNNLNYKKYAEFHNYYKKTARAVDYVKKQDNSLYRMEKTFHLKEDEPMTFSYNLKSNLKLV